MPVWKLCPCHLNWRLLKFPVNSDCFLWESDSFVPSWGAENIIIIYNIYHLTTMIWDSMRTSSTLQRGERGGGPYCDLCDQSQYQTFFWVPNTQHIGTIQICKFLPKIFNKVLASGSCPWLLTDMKPVAVLLSTLTLFLLFKEIYISFKNCYPLRCFRVECPMIEQI